MKAMILAAGRGSRMQPLTDTVPKPLLKAGGQALIDYHLQKLALAGIRDVVINHAWLGAQIEAHVGDGSRFGLQVVYSPEPPGGLETAGGLIRALPLLGNQPFLVVNGDVYSEYEYIGLVRIAQQMAEQKQQAHLVLVDNPPQHPLGDFVLHGGQIVATPEKASERGLTFAGLSVMTAEFLHGYDDSRRPLRPLLLKAIEAGALYGEYYSGVWYDVGTPQRLQALDTALKHD